MRVKYVRGVDCVRARVHRRGQPWPDKSHGRKNFTRPRGCLRSNSSPRAVFLRPSAIKRSPNIAPSVLPRIFLVPSLNESFNSCLPFMLVQTARRPLHFKIRPRATSNPRARARTPLTAQLILGATSPCTASKTFQAILHPFLRAKRSSVQKFRKMLLQRWVDHA